MLHEPFYTACRSETRHHPAAGQDGSRLSHAALLVLSSSSTARSAAAMAWSRPRPEPDERPDRSASGGPSFPVNMLRLLEVCSGRSARVGLGPPSTHEAAIDEATISAWHHSHTDAQESSARNQALYTRAEHCNEAVLIL